MAVPVFISDVLPPRVEEKPLEVLAPPPAVVSPVVSEPKPLVEQIRPKPPKEVRRVRASSAVPATKKEFTRKADIHTERVTLQISPTMRDNVAALARNLQRAKTTTDERITANTVMRVAVQVLIDHFELRAGESANSEEDLYALVCGKLKLR